jgi:hypothetical protein
MTTGAVVEVRTVVGGIEVVETAVGREISVDKAAGGLPQATRNIRRRMQTYRFMVVFFFIEARIDRTKY